MELIARYELKSILMYDNNFSWSFDSTHLHIVLLQPIYKPNPLTISSKPLPPNTLQRVAFASYTAEGRVICRNFNGPKGCSLTHRNFAHIRNRKVAGKAFAFSDLPVEVVCQFTEHNECIVQIQIFPSRHSHGQSSALSFVCILLYDLTAVLSICFNQLSRVYLLAFKSSLCKGFLLLSLVLLLESLKTCPRDTYAAIPRLSMT